MDPDVPLPIAGRSHGPSLRKKSKQQHPPPPDNAEWESVAKAWCVEAFHRRHALLLPLLSQYLQRARCSSLESFLHAFYNKEKLVPARALGAAAEFLLMEAWRANWLARDATSTLPTERKAQRGLMDPLLRSAADAVAKAPQQLHRESVEFCDAVVEHASRALRVRIQRKQEQQQHADDGSADEAREPRRHDATEEGSRLGKRQRASGDGADARAAARAND